MPEPFNPRFVDLVRNYTTTVGTGSFVLGAVVNGYSGLAGALQTGERFYYSCIGVDRPAEREVGRGTLQANGTIAREPISGALTSFNSGTKTLSLIAAAEWFTRLEAASLGASGGGGGGSSSAIAAATRTALASMPTDAPALLTEAGREGLFLFDSANLSARISADPQQGVFVAKASTPSGASGAWVRKYSGPVDVRWFGAIADNTTDCLAAINAAITFLRLTQPVGNTYQCPNGTLLFPAGRFYCSGTIQLKSQLTLLGETIGAGGSATQIRFPANTAGIVVNTHTSEGYTTPGGFNTTAEGSRIEGLHLVGGGGLVSNNADGIYCVARAFVSQCKVTGFARDGIAFAGASDANQVQLGNTNSWRIEYSLSGYNGRHGLYAAGADANAGTAFACHFDGNGAWGVSDQSFLGNSYYGCHTEVNGYSGFSATGTQAGAANDGVVTHGGNRYVAIVGQETAASITAPGTNAAVWHLVSEGTWARPWVSGQSYYSSGSYRGNCNLYGCYSEGGQGPTQLFGGRVDGGLHGSGVIGNGAVFLPTTDPAGWCWYSPINQRRLVAGVTYDINYGRGHDGIIRQIGASSDVSVGTWLESVGGDTWLFSWNGTAIWRATGPAPASSGFTRGGRSNPVPYLFMPQNLAIREWNDANLGHIVQYGSIAPTSGEHGVGEICFNSEPSVGEPIGWRCTQGGVPGVWEAFSGVGGTLRLTGDTAFPGAAAAGGVAYRNAVNGMVVYGEGSSFDLTLANKSGAAVLRVPTGTQNAEFAGDVSVADEPYGAGWNGSAKVPTRNAVFDKIETLARLGGQAAAQSVTGSTSETVLFSLVIPANTLSAGDQLRIEPVFTWTNSASSKTLAVKVGPTLASAAMFYSRGRTVNVFEAPLVAAVVRAASGANSTLVPYANSGGYAVNQSSGVAQATLDWTVPNTVFVTGTLTSTSDTVTLETVRVSRG